MVLWKSVDYFSPGELAVTNFARVKLISDT